MTVYILDNISPREVSVTPTPANENTEIVSFDKDKRTLTGVASYEIVDDYNTILAVKSMDLTRFNTVYYDHRAWGMPDAQIPIGQITHAQKTTIKGKNAVFVEIQLDKSHPTNRLSDIVLDKVDQGSLRGFSIGFPYSEKLEYTAVEDEEAENYDSYNDKPAKDEEETTDPNQII